MGELQHGTYDDQCEDLSYDEINELFGFGENEEEDGDQSDNSDSAEQEHDDEAIEPSHIEVWFS